MEAEDEEEGGSWAYRYTWDIFLSFRGEDTRHGFVKSLYDELMLNGVRVFIDDEGMERGDEIAPTLVSAIEDSAAAIAVISENYANSKWCLDELAKIMERPKRLIIPVFYDVDPSDVRWQTGSFQADFDKHERDSPDKVGRWRNAMKRAGHISGFDSRLWEISELIKVLVKKMLKKLNNTPLGVAKYPVGLDTRLDTLLSKLEVKSNIGVRVIGFHGMGGIGKTTLAKALYNKLIVHFKKRSFLSNVREESQKPNGLEYLQEKLVATLTSSAPPTISDKKKGINLIKDVTDKDPILLVLDDVDNSNQLDALAGSRDWFHDGSRIIITSRYEGFLKNNVVVDEIYKVEVLSFPDSVRLFSYHAFGKHHPTVNFKEISEKIVSLTGYLPLALEIFGSFLFYKRRMKDWNDAYEKLKLVRPDEIQDVLEISFKSLDEQQKCIFLDLACFFVGNKKMKREDAIDIFNGCGFNAETAITDLTARSLVRIIDENVLWMHDQLRDMGRQIVRRESHADAGQRTRLWDRDEILKVLKYEKGTRSIEGITLDFAKRLQNGRAVGEYDDETLCTKALKPMVNIRLLQINNAKLDGSFNSIPLHELKWLQWQGCPLKTLPLEFLTHDLAVLDLSLSKISRLWSQRWWDCHRKKMGKKLLVVNLYACRNLQKIPDLSGLCLEKLILEHCSALVVLHSSIGDMSKLTYLNLRECNNLEEFPSDVSGLKCLEVLVLSGCTRIRNLPEELSGLVSLRELLLDRTAIVKLPHSIFRLKKLEILNLNDCASLKSLPVSVGNLCSLIELSLNGSALKEIPESLGKLTQLEKLNLRSCRSLTSLPKTIGDLKSLTELYLEFSSIKNLPASIGSLYHLKLLSLNHCRNLSHLPDSIGELSSLVSLHLQGAAIVEVPSKIGSLNALEKLDLGNCQLLKSLPDSIKDLSNLKELILNDLLINALPEELGLLERLETLRLNDCKKLQRLPASFGKLKSLQYLLLSNTAVVELPDDIGSLSRLRILKIRKEADLGQAVEFVLPATFSDLSKLEELDAHAFRISGKIYDDFEKLSLLETLDLSRNDIKSLPSSMRKLSMLKKLLLAHCKELKYLPPLPPNLFKLSVANCIALESIPDLSDLESLRELDLTNCNKIIDIPGLENLKSLRWLYTGGCNACLSAIKTRLSKVALRRMRYLCVPGSKIPTWFVDEVPKFSCPKNRELKGVIIGVVVSLNQQAKDDYRNKLPSICDIQAKIIRQNEPILTTTLKLDGVPNTDEDQLYLCRFHDYNNIVFMLEEGDTLRVTMRPTTFFQGITLKKHGIHLVFEHDDDYQECDEALFPDESQQSVSKRLSNFFNSL